MVGSNLAPESCWEEVIIETTAYGDIGDENNLLITEGVLGKTNFTKLSRRSRHLQRQTMLSYR